MDKPNYTLADIKFWPTQADLEAGENKAYSAKRGVVRMQHLHARLYSLLEADGQAHEIESVRDEMNRIWQGLTPEQRAWIRQWREENNMPM